MSTPTTARTTDQRQSPRTATKRGVPPISPTEANLLSNMTYWSNRVESRLILERSSTQLELDTGISRVSITGFKRNPGLLDRLQTRGEIKILIRGTHRVNTGGRYEILRPFGPTRAEVSEHNDRLLALIRSWVKAGLISLGEVSALQGLALLQTEDGWDLNARPGCYKEIGRLRGMTPNAVRAALRHAARDLGPHRFKWRKGRGGTDAKQPVFLFKGAEKLTSDPRRMTPTARGTEALDRLYEAILAQPVQTDGWRRPFKSELRESSRLEKSRVDRLLPILHSSGRILLIPGKKDPATRQWKPVSIFIPGTPAPRQQNDKTVSHLPTAKADPQTKPSNSAKVGRPSEWTYELWLRMESVAVQRSGKAFADSLDFAEIHVSKTIQKKGFNSWAKAYRTDKGCASAIRLLRTRILRNMKPATKLARAT